MKQKQYTALVIIAGILKAIAIIAIVLSGIGFAVTLTVSGVDGTTTIAVVILIGGLMSSVILYAFGEMVDLACDVARDTNRTANAIERISDRRTKG